MNITLIGMAGAGKSVTGEALAHSLGYLFFDFDRSIEKDYGKTLQEIIEEKGEEEFKKIEEEKAIRLLDAKNTVISPGGSIVYLPRAMDILKNISRVIYLCVDIGTIRSRIDFNTRGLVGLRGKTLEELFEERKKLYEMYADGTVWCEGKDIDTVVQEILSIPFIG